MNKLELINNVLENLNLETVPNLSNIRFKTFPYNIVSDLLNESIKFINSEQNWNFSIITSNIDYVPNMNSFDLKDYDIDPNKCLVMYYTLNNNIYEVTRENRDNFKMWYSNNSQDSAPVFYSIENSIVYLYSKPDKDYGIKLIHYKNIPVLGYDTDSLIMIPDNSTESIVNYATFVMAIMLSKDNSDNFYNSYCDDISKLVKYDQVYTNIVQQLPKRIPI